MAALLVRDPNMEVCPDFDSEPFEPMRLLMRNTGLTDEQAVDALREAWMTRNDQLRDRWTQEADARAAAAEAAAQLQQQQEEEELMREQEARRQQLLLQQQNQQVQPLPPDQQEEGEAPQEPVEDEQRRTKLKLRSFDPNLSVASVIVPRPSSYAINKLANFDYCELWYFTQEGCEDAQRSQRSEADDAFGMAKMGEMVMLRPVASVQASKRVVQDADLTWEQFHYAQRSFVEHVLKAGWPEDHAQSLVRFFVHLENSPYINRENGKQILLTYQARVRRNWMDVMKQSEGAVFNIALINNDLMETIARDLQSVTTANLQRQMAEAILSFKSPHTTSAERTPKRNRAAREGATPYYKRPRSPSPSPSRGRDRESKGRRRSRSPPRHNSAATRNVNQVFGASTGSDGLSACAICLGRHRHEIGKCNSEALWDGAPARCKRNERGRLINPDGIILCSDWQRPQGCNSASASHVHECSGCGRKTHGAQTCSRTQKM